MCAWTLGKAEKCIRRMSPDLSGDEMWALKRGPPKFVGRKKDRLRVPSEGDDRVSNAKARIFGKLWEGELL